ncbi:type II CAAX prenyl endopeptidase Rce1 family protein [Gracilibacillus saliphilus]|uniref:CPBP family glutamic-type intramembrane protease n=1 Tax=Gracilibacillus saliphilus TaxID=543890 RepID=UPI0013D8754D
MKKTPIFPTSTERTFLPLLLFATLIIIVQLNNYLLMTVWAITAVLIFFINKSLRFFLWIILAFGIGFFLYNYGNTHWITDMYTAEIRVILNRFLLIIVILPLLCFSYIYRLPFIRYWQKPRWAKYVRVPFIWLGFRQVKVSTFLVIAMITNLIAFMPFISWTYIQEIWCFALIFLILNSVLEETIWRGVLLSRFSECFGNRWAVLITSVGFGLQHYSLGFSWMSCLLFSVGGFFFGAITIRSKSILPAVIWHMLFNLLMVFSGVIVG